MTRAAPRCRCASPVLVEGPGHCPAHPGWRRPRMTVAELQRRHRARPAAEAVEVDMVVWDPAEVSRIVDGGEDE